MFENQCFPVSETPKESYGLAGMASHPVIIALLSSLLPISARVSMRSVGDVSPYNCIHSILWLHARQVGGKYSCKIEQ